MTQARLWPSFFLLLSLGFIWGTGYSIARFAVTNGVTPLSYSFWQSLGPAVLITLLTLFQKQKLTFSLKHCRYYLVCGLTGIALPNSNMYFSAEHLPAGLVAALVNTVPIVTYLISLSSGIEKFNWRRFIAVGFALVGLMLMILPKTSLPSAQMVPWILSTLLTPICFAFCSVFIAKFRPAESNALTLAAGTLIFSTLLLAPFVLLTGNWYSLHSSLTRADEVILLEILLSSIGYIIFFKLIRMAGPVYYSFVDTIVVLTGLLWGYLIFGEQLNYWTGASVSCIILSLIIINKRQRNKHLTPNT
jgi:drug/metabolite transporter (DMT)-like permease